MNVDNENQNKSESPANEHPNNQKTQNSEDNRRYQCGECEFRAETNIAYQVHTESHRSQKLSCDECNYVAINKKDFTRHKRNIHTEKATQDNKEYQENRESPNEEHYENEDRGDKEQISEHEIFKCNECEFRANTNIAYRLHLETHRSRNLSCEECSYSAIHKKDLARHNRNMHTAQTIYACKLCDFSTQEKVEFHEHCTSAHTNRHESRTFNRTFRGKSSLNCNQCSYIANDIKDLRRHENTMHWTSSAPTSPEPTFSTPSPEATTTFTPTEATFHCPGGCDALQKSFEHEDALALHMLYHHTTQ